MRLEYTYLDGLVNYVVWLINFTLDEKLVKRLIEKSLVLIEKNGYEITAFHEMNFYCDFSTICYLFIFMNGNY